MGNSAQNMAAQLSSGKLTELRQRIMFVLIAVVVFRVGSFIPVPGIDPRAVQSFFDSQQGTILDVLGMFSGGALERLSIFALGVMPYISASIIMQLMSSIVPSLEELKKEGEAGRRKINQYTRYGTVLLATFQSVGAAIALQGQGIAVAPGPGFVFSAAVTLVTGTMFLMWLGEQVTERGIGNGISLIIFAGIVAGLPSALGRTLDMVSTGEMNGFVALLLFVLAIGVVAFVVYVERGQRRITVNYARRQQGRRQYAAQSSHLPLKMNMAGVIPPIFASSIILFPATLARWVADINGLSWLQDLSTALAPGQPLYTALYGALIIFFCFFYTALMFNARETADNLKRSGAFVPGIRPGEQTARYVDGVMTRLTIWGAGYIALVCLLPEFMVAYWNVPFYFGGTSLLIIVVVVMDFMAQLQSHLMSNQYEGLMKKANLGGKEA
ncbi:MAG: preprotein translocase subunit SecY [Gammaproteobacteria bacterium]|nr:preprotein translocase subunit SecY [Gammaproteobacteria bacterium]